MNKNQKRVLGVLAFLLITFSVIAFCLPFRKTVTFWAAYLIGVFSIAIQVYILNIAFKGAATVKSKFYGFPIIKVGIGYMGFQLLVSIVFMTMSEVFPVWINLIVSAIALAIAAIGFISADAARDEIERQDQQYKKNTSCMLELRSTIYPLAEQCDTEKAKSTLRNLADEFRYSDPVSSAALSGIERKLEVSVAALQDAVCSNDENSILEECKNTLSLLKERNRLCKLNK